MVPVTLINVIIVVSYQETVMQYCRCHDFMSRGLYFNLIMIYKSMHLLIQVRCFVWGVL